MACPTCDHTMHHVATAGKKDPLFWCPRCGTIKSEAKIKPFEAPMLVARAKALVVDNDESKRIDILESVTNENNQDR